ncbi:unnamed protein product, partial [Polarella glacialis]
VPYPTSLGYLRVMGRVEVYKPLRSGSPGRARTGSFDRHSGCSPAFVFQASEGFLAVERRLLLVMYVHSTSERLGSLHVQT